MRTKVKTIVLAEIRRLIREAIRWHTKDKGMPQFYNSENYVQARQPKNKVRPYYYTRSSKAIEVIAKKIYDEVNVSTNGASKCRKCGKLTWSKIKMCTKCQKHGMRVGHIRSVRRRQNG